MHTIEDAIRIAKAAAGVTIIIVTNERATAHKYPESTFTAQHERVTRRRIPKLTRTGSPRRYSQRNGPYALPTATKPGTNAEGLRFARWLTSKMNKHGLSDHMLEEQASLPYSTGHYLRSGRKVPRPDRVSHIKAFFRNLNGREVLDAPKATAKAVPLNKSGNRRGVGRRPYTPYELVPGVGDFGRWLTNIMNEHQFKDRDVAQVLGISHANVNQWRRSKQTPSLERRQQLTALFEGQLKATT